MDKKAIFIAIAAVFLVTFFTWYISSGNGAEPQSDPSQAVSIVDGKQIIDIFAKGGYSPRAVSAKAGIPTVLRVKTQGTFDCSSSLVIPNLRYQKFLAPTGTEEINLSAEQAQGTLQGLCSMGMYGFRVAFN